VAKELLVEGLANINAWQVQRKQLYKGGKRRKKHLREMCKPNVPIATSIATTEMTREILVPTKQKSAFMNM